jgi:general stress protein 26
MKDKLKDKKALWDKIKGIHFGMLTHRHPGGLLHSHPLATQNQSLEDSTALYFFIPGQSEMAALLREDAHVNVSYVSPDNDSYVSIAGQARVIHDLQRVRQLWTPMAEVSFPKGPTDPDLALLEVEIEHAQAWEAAKGRMMPLFQPTRAPTLAP